MTGGIATIGHGSASFGDLVAVLEAHGVGTIVDIRSTPYSRHAPDFNASRVADLAAAAGIGYRWLGDRLGGQPTDPRLLGPDGEPDRRRIVESEFFAAGILAIEGLAAGGRIALLCAEEDPARCHRASWIAPVLEDRGHRVTHLRHDGTAQPHQPPLAL